MAARVLRQGCAISSLALVLGALHAAQAAPSAGCAWNGPSIEWIMKREIPAVQVSGSLGAAIVPFLQRHNVPISFVSAAMEDPQIRLALSPSATVRDTVAEIIRQAPGFRYGVVDERLVIYPKGNEYDRVLNLGETKTVSRAKAYFTVLQALREKCQELRGLEIGFSGEWLGSGKMPFADQIEVGGSRSVVEHLVSLLEKRPSATFLLTPSRGKLVFTYHWVDLVETIELHVPSSAKVGETITAVVSGVLSDGRTVSLMGPDCEVGYGVSNPEVLEIAGIGQVVARRRGSAELSVEYEHRTATARVQVD